MEKSRLKIQTKNEEVIWLRAEEVEMLEQVWTHRTMQAKSIHAIYQATSHTLRNSNAISNRLTRLVELEFLIRFTKDVSVTRARVPRYYYRLGKKGLWLLAEQKRLVLNNRTRKDYHLFKNSPIPSKHTDAMSILANQIYLSCWNEIPGLTHRKGVAGKLISSTRDKKLIRENGVEPDWIFQVDNRLLCIELDTGSQEHVAIRKKFGRYYRLQKVLQKEGYQLAILFAVPDDSIDVVQKNKRKDRSVRVEGLNQLYVDYITTPVPFLQGKVEYRELKKVYALPTREAVSFAHQLLKLPEWRDDLLLNDLKSITETQTKGEER